MRRHAAACLWLVAGLAAAQGQALWWIGFIDARDRAFFEIAPERRACAERDALVRKEGAAPATPLRSRISPGRELPAGARLVFGVTDIDGRSSERVLTQVVAIVREDESARTFLPAACWYLAEAGADAPGVRVTEDRLALAVHPPRALTVRKADEAWKSYGDLAEKPGADARFAPLSEMPATMRARARALLPGATQFHVQEFEAVIDRARGPERLWLIGAIGGADGAPDDASTYNTVNLIVRPGDAGATPLYQAGPSGGIGRDRARSFAAQVAAAADLDGDGVDELLLRARYYSGGNLKVLRFNGGRYNEVREGGYEGE